MFICLNFFFGGGGLLCFQLLHGACFFEVEFAKVLVQNECVQ